MRARELFEGKNHPVICVDVQPEYSGIHDGSENPVFAEIIDFVAIKQTGPVLMFVNAEDQGFSLDTVQDVEKYWCDTVGEPEEEYWDDDEYQYKEATCPINWSRFEIVDKGYGYFRGYMDQGVNDATIIRMIRYLYLHKLNDARELDDEEYIQIMGSDKLRDEPFSINWTSVAQLKRFSGAYLVGGGRNECLREIELLMNAFNIRYKRIDSLVYG
jgi:hypothetical protein